MRGFLIRVAGFACLDWKGLRALLFRAEPERAHRIAMRLLRGAGSLAPASLRVVSGSPREFYPPNALPRVFGMSFRSRVGLAAGFDKDAELVPFLPALGFGFVEIGTVTPLPQPGNERPRLFRDPRTKSLFNRMGFNGAGASAVSRRLASAKSALAEDFRVGVNIGKNRDTPLTEAAGDYARAATFFRDLADYLVINVSSPNTPGLRSLQEAQALRPIVERVAGELAGWPRRPALLLKLAPELEGGELAALVEQAESWPIDGWVLTNTLSGTLQGLPGGWSGGALTDRARASLIEARRAGRRPIISVGGILSEGEALERRSLGAELIQIYSGWVYEGPMFPAVLSQKLAAADLERAP